MVTPTASGICNSVSFLPVYVIPNKKKMLNGISRFYISLFSLFFYEPFTEYLPS